MMLNTESADIVSQNGYFSGTAAIGAVGFALIGAIVIKKKEGVLPYDSLSKNTGSLISALEIK